MLPINSSEDLQSIDSEDSHVYLENDIDMRGTSTDEIMEFNGVLDGRGHKIKNLTTSDKSEHAEGGLIDFNYGKIKNLMLENVNMETKKENKTIGGLVGVNKGKIINCSIVDSSIEGKQSVGGLIGKNKNIVKGSSVINSTIEGSSRVGGLVGSSEKQSKIINSSAESNYYKGVRAVGGIIGAILYNKGRLVGCKSSGKIESRDFSGGIVGENMGIEIKRCSSSCKIIGSGCMIGGIAGYNMDKICRCYYNGTLIIPSLCEKIGGICGWNMNDSSIKKCYNIEQYDWIESVGDNEGQVVDVSENNDIENIKKKILVSSL